MNLNDYWIEREAKAQERYDEINEEYFDRIERIYQRMIDDCQREIDSFYGKYASSEGITIAEAKRRVEKLDIEAYSRKAEQYVKDKDFSQEANAEMRIYNLAMKVNRLELLKAMIGIEIVKNTEEFGELMEDSLRKRTIEELRRQAGILGDTVFELDELADSIIFASFYNATFSDRIWTNQNILKNELANLLQRGLIKGESSIKMARELRKLFGVKRRDAERLMRTELSRVQTDARKRSYERNGVEDYEYVANPGCCDSCQAITGKVFKVKDMVPGKNAPPLHPNCRCSTAPVIDREELDSLLDWIDKGGEIEEWVKMRDHVSSDLRKYI